MIVVTSDGRNIECNRITWECNHCGYRYLHLYRNGEDGEYEYDMIPLSRVIEIVAYKED